MMLEVSSAVIDQLRDEAARAFPRECCGLLAGTDCRIEAVIPARNVHPEPRTHFEIDPRALIDAHRAARGTGPNVLGYYHSHPDGEPTPSATDRAMASGSDLLWAIIGENAVQFWKDGPDGFQKLSYTLVDG